jgi:hypothetical protein
MKPIGVISLFAKVFCPRTTRAVSSMVYPVWLLDEGAIFGLASAVAEVKGR